MQLRDLVLPAAVILVVGMMVFPLPLPILDLLLVCNITLSLSLLLGSVYLSEPEKFTVLPTVLLLTTLFRLGLNISTTRQLLGEGQAPDVVAAFGNIVVSGNLLVGVVIFLIVTLVQFLVIAKGAERVAEVAARFTLDAMPGKQMAIDADIRAGLLSVQDARDKRRELQRESRLYGALDGAMKFVKGDAIAGLVITGINITAGLVVGVFQQKMKLADAAHKYSIFTVGDGLVSQIPALLTAVAAGIAVTRVADREGSFVGRELFSQLGKEPQALGTTATVLFAIACLPEFSFPMFGCMALLFTVAAANVSRERRRIVATAADSSFRPQILPGFSLRLSPSAVGLLQKEQLLPAEVQKFRARTFERYGIVLGDVPFDVLGLEKNVRAEIVLHGIPLLEVTPSGSEAPFSEQILHAIEAVFVRHLLEFVDDTQIRILMETHQGSCEDLMNAVVPKMISVTGLTKLFRELLIEHISVRPLPVILQTIAEYFTARELGKSSVLNGMEPDLVGLVRVALRRVISQNVVDGEGKLAAWVLGAELDRLLSRAQVSDSELAPALSDYLEDQVRELLRRDEARPLVVLCTTLARKEFADLLRPLGAEVRVLAAEELSDDIHLRILGELTSPFWEAGGASTDEAEAEARV